MASRLLKCDGSQAMVFGRGDRTLRRLGIWGTAGALLSVAGVSGAQPGSAGAAAAQALYDEARALVEQADFARACPKFRASYELDPGGGTLLNLAACYEGAGKLALAWSTFKEARVMARRDGRDDRVEFATAHIAALEQRLGKVTVSVAPAARVRGLEITIDGEVIDQAAWDVAIPIDPGEHQVVAEAPGKQPYRARLLVSPSEGKTEHHVTIPALADVTPVEAPPVPASAPALAFRAPPPRSAERARGTLARDMGFVMTGAGVAALGIGGYFGYRSFKRWDDRNDACRDGCDEKGVEAFEDARRAANLATIGVGVGAAAVGAGLYLVLSEKAGRDATARDAPLNLVVGRRAAGIAVRSRW